jgi:hypothetical protein
MRQIDDEWPSWKVIKLPRRGYHPSGVDGSDAKYNRKQKEIVSKEPRVGIHSKRRECKRKWI